MPWSLIFGSICRPKPLITDGLRALEAHPNFDAKNPNRARSVYAAWYVE